MYGKGNEWACPAWVGGDTSNPYGWWNGSTAATGACV
jgi:hypothetical protein